MQRQFASIRHHWWPKSLSGYWVEGPDCCVTQLSFNGRILRQAPGDFGFDKHTHNIRIGGPWNSSFEQTFNSADSNLPSLVDWLITLEAKHVTATSVLRDRLLAQSASVTHIGWLAECLSSLILRSPAMRNRITKSVEAGRKAFGLEAYGADTTLIAMNMRPLYDSFCKKIAVSGKFAVLFSDDAEFIFGDGFMQTFPTTAPVYNHPRCIVPLTPTISVAYDSPIRYAANSRLVTLRLQRDETVHLNDIVQACSKDSVFYRYDKPSMLPCFTERRHYDVLSDQGTWLHTLFEELAAFSGHPR